MAGPGEDGALGSEPLLEHVTNHVESGVVRSGDEELRKRSVAQLLEGDHGFVRRPLDERGTGAGFETRRQRVREVECAADERQEELEIGAGLTRRLVEVVEESLDRGLPPCYAKGRGLVDGQRAQAVRPARGREQRDDPPYEWPTRWSPGSSRSAISSACSSKSMRSSGGFGG